MRNSQFTIHLHYPPRPAASGLQPTSFTAILRGHILSVRSPQVRYVVRGTHGTFLKFGVDVQEDQLRVIPSPVGIVQDEAYGVEPEDIWGTVENVGADGQVVKSTYVLRRVPLGQDVVLTRNTYVGGRRLSAGRTSICSRTSPLSSETAPSSWSSGRSPRRLSS